MNAGSPGARFSSTLAGLMLIACGGGGGGGGRAKPTLAIADGHAPGWARAGDEREGKASLFVCQGEGKTEADALTTAGALCDDKICKLCGVEVESVVQAEETLTGVELKRKVVERCRMIRTAEPEITRKSVDCGPAGCIAWIQLRYTDAQKDESCQRLEDGKFAGPEACQETIDAFSRVPGYDAASFRRRTTLLDRAMVDCAEIDVRPTPLMGSLDAKLKAGMAIFNRPEADTPGWLKRYWLAPDAPLWKRYEEDPKFVARLRHLRGYTAHKALLMDVVEASEPEDLDSKAAVERIARACEAVSPDEAYGVRRVQMLAASALYDRWSSRRFSPSTDVSPVRDVLMKQYPPEGTAYPEDMTMAQLFSVGGVIDAAEWAYLMRTPVTGPATRRGLEVRDHGGGATRRTRFKAALERALAGVEGPKRVRRFEHVLPADLGLLLEVEREGVLPPDVRAHLTWPFLKDVFNRGDRDATEAERQAFLDRMTQALAVLPEKPADRRARCLGLADDLEALADAGRPTRGQGALVCTCLTDVLGDEGLSLVNRHDLYERALAEGLPCVSPLP